MQIKTAFAIGSGIVIGVIIGMCISEDTKCKILGKVRKNLIYALGGEEKKNYTTFRNPTYHGTYADYNKVRKEQVPVLEDLLIFEDYKSADECLNMMKEFVETNHNHLLSVHNLCMMRGKHIDYTWDAYGWNKEDITNAFVIPYDRFPTKTSAYEIAICKPKILEEE